MAIVAVEASPPKQHVARRLDHPLTLDHALAGMIESSGLDTGFQHRWTSLLELQEQWCPVSGFAQDNPAESAVASDPDHLPALTLTTFDPPLLTESDPPFQRLWFCPSILTHPP
jgi:hypothetical protein